MIATLRAEVLELRAELAELRALREADIAAINKNFNQLMDEAGRLIAEEDNALRDQIKGDAFARLGLFRPSCTSG